MLKTMWHGNIKLNDKENLSDVITLYLKHKIDANHSQNVQRSIRTIIIIIKPLQ